MISLCSSRLTINKQVLTTTSICPNCRALLLFARSHNASLLSHTITTSSISCPRMSKYSPIISPTISSPSLTTLRSPPIVRRLSTSSVHNLPDIVGNASPTTSIRFAQGDVEAVTEQGLRHADIKLEAR